MSDDEGSGSSSAAEDLNTTGLVATRAKRQTAGNLYETLRANLDDEELQKELLAEDEAEDAEDYQISDLDDDDAAMESSSDGEDAGPPKEGEEDLEGEREVKRAERAELKKKRKFQEGRMRLPGKRVKLAEGVKMEDGGSEGLERLKKKKKSERSNWLPEGADAPTRQSTRGLAVANREVIHKNLVQSAARSERQKLLMKDAAKKAKATDRLGLNREERLQKCKRIERETAKELGRFEREEAERVRAREEALAAKRKRGIDGPVMRVWSGSGVYEMPDNGQSDWKLKAARMEGRTLKDYEVEVERKQEEAKQEAMRKAEEARRKEAERVEAARKEAERLEAMRIETEKEEAARREAEKSAMDIVNWSGDASDQIASSPQQAPQGPDSWLSGIHEYAAQSDAAPVMPYTPSALAMNGTAASDAQSQQQVPLPPQQSLQPVAPAPMPPLAEPQPATPLNTAPFSSKPSQAPSIHPSGPPGSGVFVSKPEAAPPAPAPAPVSFPPTLVLRAQAQRTLLILEAFPSLAPPASTTTKARKSLGQPTSTTEPTPLSSLLLPSAYPPLTADQRSYLAPPPKRKPKDILPEPPTKPRCCITGWPARYHDPKTGLPYADTQTYKIIQRVLAGGCAWSGLLGSWVGPAYGRMGRPARGVPGGFAGDDKAGGVKKEGG